MGLAQEREEPALAPTVLLAVAALAVGAREESLDRQARSEEREPRVVDLVDEVDEQQRAPLVVERCDSAQHHGVEALEHRGGLHWRHHPEVGDQLREGVIAHRRTALREQRAHHAIELTGAERLGLDPGLGPVVRSVDANDLEVRCDRRDLAA